MLSFLGQTIGELIALALVVGLFVLAFWVSLKVYAWKDPDPVDWIRRYGPEVPRPPEPSRLVKAGMCLVAGATFLLIMLVGGAVLTHVPGVSASLDRIDARRND